MGGLNQIISSLSGQAPVPRLTYNPGPGIYSRLERAVEAMPENVRVQELPGLLKRYKDGVPGWELKATNLDEVIAGRDVVPREELLARVKERSPVYTHGEVILGGRPQIQHVPAYVPVPGGGGLTAPGLARMPDYQFPDTGEVSGLGQGVSHGPPRYEQYGQGGQGYTELLLTQPGAERLLAPPHAGTDPEFQVAPRVNYGSHWSDDTKDAVAHARFDTHGDALRINELQSDLGIHNRKARERAASGEPPVPAGWADTGSPRSGEEIPFPLEDAWADLLIKRLALEAARQGHRAIEVASPRAIADKVGGNIDNYEHFYGKVVPGALERLGRKMGGLVEEVPPTPVPTNRQAMDAAYYDAVNRSDVSGLDNRASAVQSRARQLMSMLGAQTHRLNAGHFNDGGEATMKTVLHNMADDLAGIVGPERMNEMYLQANEVAAAHAARTHAINMGIEDVENVQRPPGRRYTMSDEMRRRIIEQGIGASVLAPLLMQDE